ncbi:PDZ and LIM domain protein 4 [Temnothorax americanus]|uniref:PDZ and LIM domain protein 4 n=1 Tax=Temnothorax americanus TaxID=1964332 RepID=UPI004068F979
MASDVLTTDVKLSRCNNQPWGFRLSGGVDFAFPLTVVRVTIEGLAHTAGLQAGDVIVRLNGEPISQLTHAQVHNKLVSAGDDIVLSVVRSHEIARRQREQ